MRNVLCKEDAYVERTSRAGIKAEDVVSGQHQFPHPLLSSSTTDQLKEFLISEQFYFPNLKLFTYFQIKMNPLYLVAFLAVGATAASYGNAPSVRVESVPQRASYAAPAAFSSGYDSQPIRQQVPILRFEQDIQGSGANSVKFETGNGISSSFNTQVVRGRPHEYMDESGRMVQSDESLDMSGHSYHEVEGRHISLNWRADENGFHATGDHLPQPVPLPAEHAEAHRQALALAARNPAPAYESYNAPAVIRQSSYAAPAAAPAPVVIRQSSYAAPAVRSQY